MRNLTLSKSNQQRPAHPGLRFLGLRCKSNPRRIPKSARTSSKESLMEKEGEERAASTEDAADRGAGEPDSSKVAGSAKAKAPEVEVHLFRRGKGPPAVFRSQLGGWDQDRLEVQDILDKHGLKSLFAFNPASGRGVPIRFSPRNGRSLLPYADGAVIFVDGVPKDPLVKPVTKILLGVAATTLVVALLVKETPEWFKASRFSGGSFPPWILACVVIVFTRGRKRTRDLLKRYGWLR